MLFRPVLVTLLLLLLLLLLNVDPVHGAREFTTCGTQLGNAMGTNLTIPFVTIEQLADVDIGGGVFLPATRVTVSIETAIDTHVANRNSSLSYMVPDDAYTGYVTLPYPWCTHEVQSSSCVSQLAYGVDRFDPAGCPLRAKDFGTTSDRSPFEAGRITAFPLKDPACVGEPLLFTYIGVSADRIDPTFNDVYTYSYANVLLGRNGTGPGSDALFQEATCAISDGFEDGLNTGPDEFICGPDTDLLLRCPAGGHPADGFYGPDIGIQIICTDSIENSGISSTIGAPSGNRNAVMRVEPRYISSSLVAEVDIQFDPLLFTTPDISGRRFVWNGLAAQIYTPYRNLTFAAKYRTDNEPYIEAPIGTFDNPDLDSIPPCICGVTVQCDGLGRARSEAVYDPQNVPPVAVIVPDPIPDGRGFFEYNATREFILVGVGSTDPDGSPVSPIRHYWDLIEAPAGGEISFSDRGVISPRVNFTGITGEYVVAHYVSDGQDVSVDSFTYNVVGYPPVIAAVGESVLPEDGIYVNKTISIVVIVSDPDNYPGIGINTTLEEKLAPANYTLTKDPALNPPGGAISIFTARFSGTGTFLFIINSTDSRYFTTKSYTITVTNQPPPFEENPPLPVTPSDDCPIQYPGAFCMTNRVFCESSGQRIINENMLCETSGGICCAPPINNTTPSGPPSLPTTPPPPFTGPPSNFPSSPPYVSPIPPAPDNGTVSEPSLAIYRFDDRSLLQYVLYIAILSVVALLAIVFVVALVNRNNIYNGLYRAYDGTVYTGEDIPGEYQY